MATASAQDAREEAGGEPLPRVLKRKLFHVASIGGMATLAALAPRTMALHALVVVLVAMFATFLFMSFQPRPERKAFVEEALRADKRFPAQGTVFALVGALAALLLFPAHVAAAGLAVLALGDGLSTLYAIRFGRVKVPWMDRFADAWLVGVGAGAAAAALVVPLAPALLASAVAQLPDLVPLPKGAAWADDNLLTPVLAGAVLALVGV